MLKFIAATASHCFRIQTFQHDGRGLPEQKGGALNMLLALYAVTRIAYNAVTPDTTLLVTAIEVLLFIGIMPLGFRPKALSVLTLAYTAANIIGAVLVLNGIQRSHATWLLLPWSMFAFIVTMRRSTAQARPTKNIPSEKKD